MLLEVRDLSVSYRLPGRVVEAVRGVSLSLEASGTLGLVGESGAGKSTLAHAVLGRLPSPGRIEAGRVLLDGQDLLEQGARLRWREVAMVPQGAMSALNPVLRVGLQIEEVLAVHRGLGRRARRARVGELLRLVQLDPALARAYPHQLSGGSRQRALIAMALACEPRLLVADEPTTNLDVITQRDLLDMLDQVRRQLGTALLLVSHDLAVILRVCERVAVVARGEITETGRTAEVLARPEHRQTQRLVDAFLRLPAWAEPRERSGSERERGRR